MKISFISTVFNEEDNIVSFIESIFSQTKKPNEIIIVDGGSTDATASVIFNFQFSIFNKNPKTKKIKFKTLTKKGNRAVGRNEAIRNATGDIILISDAGCVLDKDWVRNITKPFLDSRLRGNDNAGGNDSVDGAVDVVAGYYKGKADSIFQKCLVPYVLVMPDKVDSDNFLPASRSMAFRKSVWKKVGGFQEKFSHNEDYVFANNLKKINAKIVFQKDAIVYWTPRKNLKDAFIMFYRFAKGDAESHIFRPKVIVLFSRYIIGLILLFLSVVLRSYLMLNTLCLTLLLYLVWSVIKNYKYVKDIRAIFILPLLQLTSDITVMLGTVEALLPYNIKILGISLLILSIVYSTILLNFRQMRALFNPPEILDNRIVGYAQYFGYPVYFETIIFFIFIFSPIISLWLLSYFKKDNESQNR